MEENSTFDIFNEILAAAMKSNPENAFFIHKSFKSISLFQVNAASFIVITTSVEDPVTLRIFLIYEFLLQFLTSVDVFV